MGHFPSSIAGTYGDEKVAQSTKIGGLPLGQLMILPDGSEYRLAQAQTSAVLAPGKPVTAGSVIPDHGCGTADQLAATVQAIGVTEVLLKAGGTTAIIADYYADGNMFVRDADGEGYQYRIVSNNSAATGSTSTVILEPTDGLIEALTASSLVGLRRNLYKEVLTRPTGASPVGPIVGVPVAAVSAGFFCWLLTKGLGTYLAAGTAAVIGDPAIAATAVAGSLGPIGVAASTIAPEQIQPLGQVQAVSDDTEYGLVAYNIS